MRPPGFGRNTRLAAYATENRNATAASVRLLSVLPAEVPGAIERMQAEAKDAKRRTRELQAQLASYEAEALAAGDAESRLVIRALEGWDQNGLKSIALAICERPGFTAVLIGTSSPSPVVIARGPGSVRDSAVLLRKIVEKFGGKGGGRPELAQGGGLQGDPGEIVAFARSLVLST